jgi:hypothetical protein
MQTIDRARRLSLVFGLAVLLGGCAPKPPDIQTRPPDVQRAFTAKDVLDQIKVLSETAIMANAQHRLSDVDTGYVRDFVLPTTAALEAYVPGGPTYGALVGVREAFLQLQGKLTPAAQTQLAGVLRLLQATINGFAPATPIPGGQS